MSFDQDDLARRLLALSHRTGYEVVQKSGQRIYGGPPPGWTGPPPDKGTEIYCYRIPRDCFEDELEPMFSRAGRIYELRLMIEFSGTNRSYCYVRYTKPEEAREAIRKLHNFPIRPGCCLAITRSVDNRKLCLKLSGSLEVDPAKVADELNAVVGGVNSVRYLTKQWLDVEFETHRAAALARRQLVPGNIALFDRFEVRQVDWADPEKDAEVESETASRVLCVGNLPPSATQKEVLQLFSPLGRVERVDLSESQALVCFPSSGAARRTLDQVQSRLTLGGNVLQVSWWTGGRKRLDRGVYSSQPRHVPSGPARQPSVSKPGPAAHPVEELEWVAARQGWGRPRYQCEEQGAGATRLYRYSVSVPAVPGSSVPGDWVGDREAALQHCATVCLAAILDETRRYHGFAQTGTEWRAVRPPAHTFSHAPTFSLPATTGPPHQVLQAQLNATNPSNTEFSGQPRSLLGIRPISSSSGRPAATLLSSPDSPRPVLAVPPHRRPGGHVENLTAAFHNLDLDTHTLDFGQTNVHYGDTSHHY